MKSLIIFVCVIIVLSVCTRKKGGTSSKKEVKRYDGTPSRKTAARGRSTGTAGNGTSTAARKRSVPESPGGTGTAPGKDPGYGPDPGRRSPWPSPKQKKAFPSSRGTLSGKLPGRTPKPDLYRLEDRDNDWLARQLKDESRIHNNSLDQEISAVRLRRQIESKKRALK